MDFMSCACTATIAKLENRNNISSSKNYFAIKALPSFNLTDKKIAILGSANYKPSQDPFAQLLRVLRESFALWQPLQWYVGYQEAVEVQGHRGDVKIALYCRELKKGTTDELTRLKGEIFAGNFRRFAISSVNRLLKYKIFRGNNGGRLMIALNVRELEISRNNKVG